MRALRLMPVWLLVLVTVVACQSATYRDDIIIAATALDAANTAAVALIESDAVGDDVAVEMARASTAASIALETAYNSLQQYEQTGNAGLIQSAMTVLWNRIDELRFLTGDLQ